MDTGTDLFSTPSVQAPPPAKAPPATPPQSNDLFPPAEPAPAEKAPSTPAEPPASAPSDLDLFGPPADNKPAEKAPPAEKPATEEDTSGLFGSADAILGQPGGLASQSLRHWVDDTGSFSCEGRMIRLLDGKVQILKASGRTTTVPLARLSQADLEFVNRQASAQQAEAVSKTAQVSTGWSH